MIIKEGEVQVKVNTRTETLGKNSVIVIMPGDKAFVKSLSPSSTYYTMIYKSKGNMDVRRARKSGGSTLINFEDLDFKEHDKGGIRNFFHRSTAMCPYYEMHVTTLKSGIKSHEPHTHYATEVVLVISGQTEMEIGNGVLGPRKGIYTFFPPMFPMPLRI